MGTNYYARPIKTIQQIQSEVVHIGKSSVGWKFLFNHNDWQYFTNIEEMKEWLKDQEIESEYGKVISFEDFWEMVEKKQEIQSPISNKSWYVFKEGFEFSSSTSFS